MKLFEIACSLDDESNKAEAIGNIMTLMLAAGASDYDIELPVILEGIRLIQNSLYEHQKRLAELSNLIIDELNRFRGQGVSA